MPHHFWTGFYLAASEDELQVGPYQGPVACQVLRGRGVCLECARTRRPVVVPDVERFAGHIACDPRSKSEIALPVLAPSTDGPERVAAVLDIDAAELRQFDEEDVAPLQRILSLLQPFL
jgi:GAF domain-containing protein